MQSHTTFDFESRIALRYKIITLLYLYSQEIYLAIKVVSHSI